MNSSNLLKSSVLVTLFSLANVLINFLSSLVIAYYFGASQERDFYFAAIAVPTYFSALFTGSIPVLVLPALSRLRISNNSYSFRSVFNSMLLICSIGLFIIGLFVFFAAPQILTLTAPGFSPFEMAKTSLLLKILIFSLPAQGLFAFIITLYHIRKQFLIASIAPVVGVVINIAAVFLLYSEIGIASVAVGYVAGSLVSLIIVSPVAIKSLRRSYRLSFFNKEVMLLLKASLPLIASGIIFRSTTLIERVIASGLPDGSISYLGYSSQLMMVMASLVSGGIATTFFPVMADAWAQKDKNLLSNYVSKATITIAMLLAPIVLLILTSGELIISVVFERGAFTQEDVIGVSNALKILMGALVFGSLGNIISKIFYLTDKTVAFSVIAIIELLIYIIFSLAFISNLSYLALSLGLTISSAANVLIAVCYLQINFKVFAFMEYTKPILQLLLTIFLTLGITVVFHFTGYSLDNFLKIVIYFTLILAPFLVLYLENVRPSLFKKLKTDFKNFITNRY